MKGLEIAKQYYLQFGAPMIAEQFPQLESVIAAGLVGSGSECFGFDDDISRDHDFEPGFCLFIPDIIDRQTAFALERAYAKLPSEFMGLKRLKIQPVGGCRHGVIRISDFYRDKIGSPDGFHDLYDWFRVPEYALAEATNGEVFRDDAGLFTSIRENLLDIPEDVRKKKIAGHLLMMAQAGQYNYPRCLQHKETAAAQLTIHEFVQHTMNTVFLLNGEYMPFYKWSFRALRELPKFADRAQDLEFLISSPNDASTVMNKEQIIHAIAIDLVDCLIKQKLSMDSGIELELQAYSVNQSIIDSRLRNEHILFAI